MKSLHLAVFFLLCFTLTHQYSHHFCYGDRPPSTLDVDQGMLETANCVPSSLWVISAALWVSLKVIMTMEKITLGEEYQTSQESEGKQCKQQVVQFIKNVRKSRIDSISSSCFLHQYQPLNQSNFNNTQYRFNSQKYLRVTHFSQERIKLSHLQNIVIILNAIHFLSNHDIYSLRMPIQIKVISAHLSRDTQTFSKMDPYCVLKLGNQTHRTRVKNEAGKKPVWNQTFNIKGGDNDLIVRVLDEDTFSDDVVGEGRLNLGKFRNSSGDQEEMVQLMYKGKAAGKVHLRIKGSGGGGNNGGGQWGGNMPNNGGGGGQWGGNMPNNNNSNSNQQWGGNMPNNGGGGGQWGGQNSQQQWGGNNGGGQQWGGQNSQQQWGGQGNNNGQRWGGQGQGGNTGGNQQWGGNMPNQGGQGQQGWGGNSHQGPMNNNNNNNNPYPDIPSNGGGGFNQGGGNMGGQSGQGGQGLAFNLVNGMQGLMGGQNRQGGGGFGGNQGGNYGGNQGGSYGGNQGGNYGNNQGGNPYR